MSLYYKVFSGPLGILKLVASDEALVAILWEHEIKNSKMIKDALQNDQHPLLLKAEKQLREYFTGRRKDFDLPLQPQGSPFQGRVWKALRRIPFGETRSYGEIAKEVGNPKACRAVGLANGRNPIPIIVPCHRVIGKNGSLTGFAGGLPNKKILLEIESLGSRS